MPIIGGRGAGVRGLGFQGAGAPAQVTGLTATNVGSGRAFNNGRIDLAWTAPATNGAPITGYFIERSTNSGSTWSTLVASTGNANVSYSDTGLTSAQRYDYRVSAINAVGTGLASTSANATATTVPQAPTIGTATAGNAQATITFTANATGGSAITTFTSTSSPAAGSGSSATSPITHTGLSNGTSYTFTVTATNANGISAASSASNSVTLVAPYSLSQTFNTSGTYTVPSGVSKLGLLMVGGGNSSGQGSKALGVWDISVTPGQNYTVTVAGNGGTSSFGSIASVSVSTATYSTGTGTSANGGGRSSPGSAGGIVNPGQSGMGTIQAGGGGGSGGDGAFETCSFSNLPRSRTGSSGASGGANGGGNGGRGANTYFDGSCYIGSQYNGTNGTAGQSNTGGGGGGGGTGSYYTCCETGNDGGSDGPGGSGKVIVYAA